MYFIGEVSTKAKKLVRTTYEAMIKSKGGDPNLTKVTSEIKLKNLQLGLLMGRKSTKATN